MNEIRMTKDMKFLLLQLISFDSTPERLASIVHNEFCDKPSELLNSKLLKESMRLLNHCDNYWGSRFVEEFIVELNKMMEWAGVKVEA